MKQYEVVPIITDSHPTKSPFFMVIRNVKDAHNIELRVVMQTDYTDHTSLDDVISQIKTSLLHATEGKPVWGGKGIDLHRASNKIAQSSRRGVGNVRFGEFIMYASTKFSTIDQPFAVYGTHAGEYRLFVSPALLCLVERIDTPA